MAQGGSSSRNDIRSIRVAEEAERVYREFKQSLLRGLSHAQLLQGEDPHAARLRGALIGKETATWKELYTIRVAWELPRKVTIGIENAEETEGVASLQGRPKSHLESFLRRSVTQLLQEYYSARRRGVLYPWEAWEKDSQCGVAAHAWVAPRNNRSSDKVSSRTGS